MAINLAGLGLSVTVVEQAALSGGRVKGATLGERSECSLDTGSSILQLPAVLTPRFVRSGKTLPDYVTLKQLAAGPAATEWGGAACGEGSFPACPALSLDPGWKP